MKQKLIITIVAIIAFSVTQMMAQGKVLESKTIESKVLAKQVKYSVYLPPDYEMSNRSYPVLYLLHGYTDNETSWIQFGQINEIADKLIANGTIAPMIIVMPDGGNSFYINDASGKQPYEKMFFEEFIPQIEKTYRIRSQKEFRAIAGNSMGGFGSLIYALLHPNDFAACVPLSSAVITEAEMRKRNQTNDFGLRDLFGEIKNDSMPQSFARYNILKMIKDLTKEQIEKVNFYIDCGDKDFLVIPNCTLHIAMTEKQIKHEFRIREGVHNWGYWRVGIADGLKFISQSFHR